jgi:nitroreductase
MKSFTQQLSWRRAVKKFLPDKKVAESNLQTVLQAIQMTPTSFGLQPYYVKVVTDRPLLEKLRKVAWDQQQITTCSHLLVFVARTDVNQRITEYLDQKTAGDAKKKAAFAEYEGMMRGSVGKLPEHEAKTWAQKQLYIALGFAMAACAELGVDSCPMEGFVGAEFDKLLDLPKGHYSTVLLTLGDRDPSFEMMPQARFPLQDLIRK